MNNNRPITLLDNIRKDRKRRRQARITTGENVDIGAFFPRDIDRGVDGLLDVFTVKVERCLFLGERPWKA